MFDGLSIDDWMRTIDPETAGLYAFGGMEQ